MVIPKFIISELKKIKDARGIVLVGSRSLGKESVNSDWDFYVLLENGKGNWRKTLKVKNALVEVFASDETQIEKNFVTGQEIGRGVDIHMFANAKIVVDNSKGTLKKIINKAKKLLKEGPNKLLEKHIEWAQYTIADKIDDLKDCIQDNNPQTLFINSVPEEFVNWHYQLNRKWIPRKKDKLDDIKKHHKDIYNYIQKINDSSDWKNKAKFTIELGNAIGKKFHLNLDGTLP